MKTWMMRIRRLSVGRICKKSLDDDDDNLDGDDDDDDEDDEDGENEDWV